MRKFSVFAIAREAVRGHKGWEEQWASPEPRKEYDVVIVGAGGHGLATAYYLAKEHGVTNVAVVEKGWLGGGNTGRNTTIIRSNYLYDESAGIYDHAVKLWDGLSQDLNYNVMYSARGVHIIQNCEVTGVRRSGNGHVTGVETTRGFIGAKKIGVVAAGHSSVIMQMAGVRMPLESYPLQALVSEPVKPIFPCVVMSNAVHAYISQSDKGELVIGAGTDQYVSYSQQGGLHVMTDTLAAICELFPQFSRMRMLRSWGGIVDVTPDRSPIIGLSPIPGLYVNCGWGTGGFKATPGSGHVFAHTIARGEPHPIAAP